ncbi:MAG: type I glutamate--ammonia ligase [Fimbriimonadia bacterium]
MSPREVVQYARDNDIEIVDYRYTDPIGSWHHYSMPVNMFSEASFEEGIGFDGSSIRCFKTIEQSDMLLIPDPDVHFIDPFSKYKTLVIVCDIIDPETRRPYDRSPRLVARNAVEYMRQTGIADTVFFGPELEFHVFDEVRFDQNNHSSMHFVDCAEGIWNSGRVDKPAPGHKMQVRGGYTPVPPNDTLQDLRGEMIATLRDVGVEMESHHHEVGAAGQCELGLRFAQMLRQADQVMIYKYVIKNVAFRNGFTATFMPKPIYGDNGSGMHCHQSLWKNEQNLMYDEHGYAGLSKLALHYIGGLLEHAPSILAFAAPTTNSYRRLVPGYEAPINLVYSKRNRSACIRIPTFNPAPHAKRLEFRAPDPSCNPYLAFAAQLMAGLDGIRREIVPPDPIEKDVYHLSPEEDAKVRKTPGSLADALTALERDNEYLTTGGVFSTDLLQEYIRYKREEEVLQLSLRPHPYEFMMYYGV